MVFTYRRDTWCVAFLRRAVNRLSVLSRNSVSISGKKRRQNVNVTSDDVAGAGLRFALAWGLLVSILLVCGGCATSPQKGAPDKAPSDAETLPESVNVLPADEATVVAYPETEFHDPLMGFNRAMFTFNDVSYRYVMIPVAKAYNYTPQGFRTGVDHFFANLKSPKSIVNHLLQAEGKRAGVTTLRFLANTTIGLLGIFDPADAWFGLEADTTGFNDTLERWGVGRGPFLVLPFLGPADLRSTGGLVGDFALNPVRYITEQPATTLVVSADAEQEFAPQAERYDTLHKKTKDPYIFFRNMYLQGQLRDEQYKTIANTSDRSRRVQEDEQPPETDKDQDKSKAP